MRKLLAVAIMGILLLGLVGCGSKATNKPSEGKTEGPIVLKFNYFSAETIPPGLASKGAAKIIEEKTGGKVKVEQYYSGTLLSYDDSFQGVARGVADIALVESGQVATLFKLNQVFSKPLLKTPPDRVGLTKAFRELVKTCPELNQELEKIGVRWVSVSALPGYNLHTVKKVIRTPEDLKGMKVESLGDAVEYFSQLGAAAVSLDPGDYYTSLERGLIEGQFTHWAVLDVFKVGELLHTHTIFGDGEGGLYAPVMGYIINVNTWNSLPPEVQKILEEAYDWAGDEMIRLDVETVARAKELAEKQGDVFVRLTDQERQAWAEPMKPTLEKWFSNWR